MSTSNCQPVPDARGIKIINDFSEECQRVISNSSEEMKHYALEHKICFPNKNVNQVLFNNLRAVKMSICVFCIMLL